MPQAASRIPVPMHTAPIPIAVARSTSPAAQIRGVQSLFHVQPTFLPSGVTLEITSAESPLLEIVTAVSSIAPREKRIDVNGNLNSPSRY